MLHALSDPALVIEGQDRVLAANGPACTLFGDSLVGRELAQLGFSASPLLEENPEFADPGTQGGGGPNAPDPSISWKVWSFAQEEPLTLQFHSDPRWFRPSVGGLPDPGRRLLVLRDVSDQIEARQQVHAVRHEFLSAAAHKFTTPPTAIKMHVHLLKTYERRRDPESPQLAQLAMLDSHLTRLSLEVNEVLDLAQLRMGRLDLQLGPVDFVALVKGTVAEFGARRSEREIRLETSAPYQVARLDAPRIEQVVRQLMDNADRYSHAGTPITVHISGDEERVVLEVSDQGVGIPAETLRALFTPFLRGENVKTLRMGTGLGLGLYLSRALVEQHEGTLEIDSDLERGTRVIVRLPRGLRR